MATKSRALGKFPRMHSRVHSTRGTIFVSESERPLTRRESLGLRIRPLAKGQGTETGRTRGVRRPESRVPSGPHLSGPRPYPWALPGFRSTLFIYPEGRTHSGYRPILEVSGGRIRTYRDQRITIFGSEAPDKGFLWKRMDTSESE